METRDYSDTVRDLRSLVQKEAKSHSETAILMRQVLRNVEDMAAEIKEQRKEIISLRLKAEHAITRAEVFQIAADATEVVTERVNNLWKFVTATQVAFGSVLTFVAARLFGH